MLVVTMVVAVIVMLEKMLVGCDGWQMLLWWCHVVISDIHHKWYDDRDYDDGDGDGNDDIRIENYVITTDAR